ncbi:MAG: nucleotidyltransferase family protein [Bacteroidetes bacterium]|nr:nucleotidyltransferase family protein [Bacteroidota bacterium]MDA1120658.1 nucleotidyltransferase family protein [Bacteroidota bacterium]
MKISALILAAGESKRMGKPKQLLSFNGKTLLSHAIDSIEPIIVDIKVVLGANYNKISESINGRAVEIIRNNQWSNGMGSSLAKGIESLSKDSDGVLIMLCDQPLITKQHLKSLVDHFLKHQITICSGYSGVSGVPAIFPKKLFPDLMKISEDKGAGILLTQINKIVIDCPWATKDIDSMEDYQSITK